MLLRFGSFGAAEVNSFKNVGLEGIYYLVAFSVCLKCQYYHFIKKFLVLDSQRFPEIEGK